MPIAPSSKIQNAEGSPANGAAARKSVVPIRCPKNAPTVAFFNPIFSRKGPTRRRERAIPHSTAPPNIAYLRIGLCERGFQLLEDIADIYKRRSCSNEVQTHSHNDPPGIGRG